jgi:aspartyl-tRNA(Asn)/glutamyl-tRNA(Gln) amidotransferase subunit B
MLKYKPTIGLEIHAELNTQTKMFCTCKNDPDEERANVNICPICMGHPGTLPVINKQAVINVLKVGRAIGGQLADLTEFDRKNYFYPDIPKGYQISQYKHPLVTGGELGGVAITRVHLEEDTATSIHVEDPERSIGKGEDFSLVNFNRAGVPLMELVTEPAIHSGADAVKFGKELQLLLQYLGVAEANMEKGEMRLEANVSVSDSDKLGTKVEIKNLNSFKIAEKAIDYEIKRQSKLLENGEKVLQETRGWNEAKHETFSQRSKEDSHDYRYFPDPDLPKLKISELDLDLAIAETPHQKRDRYSKDYKIKESDIEVFVGNKKLSDLFEAASVKLSGAGGKDLQLLANYIISDVSGEVEPGSLAEVILMIERGEISSRGAKDLLAILMQKGGDPRQIAEQEGLFQKSDKGELTSLIKAVLAENESVVAEYKSGKVSSLQYLVGQSMKAAKGSGNPGLIKEILLELLQN